MGPGGTRDMGPGGTRDMGSGRFLSDVTENGWNDDGCGKKDVFP